MAMNTEETAAARQRLLVVMAMLLEALYDKSAVEVLATLKPTDMRSGGARIPGTSYELPPETAARVMQQLLAQRGCTVAGPLLIALAETDVVARHATLTGAAPPVIGTLYPLCRPTLALSDSESMRAALLRLFAICEQFFTLTQMRRLDELLYAWGQAPQDVDTMPVQKFIAQFVRNAPP